MHCSVYQNSIVTTNKVVNICHCIASIACSALFTFFFPIKKSK